jgi:hypothetical protein
MTAITGKNKIFNKFIWFFLFIMPENFPVAGGSIDDL